MKKILYLSLIGSIGQQSHSMEKADATTPKKQPSLISKMPSTRKVHEIKNTQIDIPASLRKKGTTTSTKTEKPRESVSSKIEKSYKKQGASQKLLYQYWT